MLDREDVKAMPVAWFTSLMLQMSGQTSLCFEVKNLFPNTAFKVLIFK